MILSTFTFLTFEVVKLISPDPIKCVHVKWTSALNSLIQLFIYRTLYAIDRYLRVLSLKMSEELILEWTIFIGIYVFLLVLFFFNIYLCLSFLILYVILRIIQSRYKKLLPVKSKAVLVTGCDRGKSIYVHV